MRHRAAGVVALTTGLALAAWALYSWQFDGRPGVRIGFVGLMLLRVFCRAGFTWFRGRLVR